MKTSPSRWFWLIVFSGVAVALLESLHLPAALLLGPMVAAIVFAARDKPVTIHRHWFYLAQGVVGCMIARAIPSSVFIEMAKNWPLFIACVLSAIIASTFLGWLLTHYQVLPGSTAIWGSSPGAASAMTLMAESYGADVRLVAFMQYLRVVIVAITATLVAQFWAPPSTASTPAVFNIIQPIAWGPFGATLVLIIAGVMTSRYLRIPAGPLLISLVCGMIVQDTHLLKLELPPVLLMASYAIIGWNIGLRFNREILLYAAKALPRLLLSIFSLVAICGGFAFMLVHYAGIDPLTAYLATSPGGADSVAIIASSSKVDISFVMSMQTGRFLLVLITGPALAKWVTNSMAARQMKHRDHH
ncbi:AbrB family transcriptional regulator [Erwinia endophytica]|uniref:AbrB family transcriptional regulator n=1 Tax=Erwinia endophytica TaxID=1563158 RepID=UPI001F050167|nr:AbrB family transcriptional regulator [Erwinia endophytica]